MIKILSFALLKINYPVKVEDLVGSRFENRVAGGEMC